jgi:hypothetical protein
MYIDEICFPIHGIHPTRLKLKETNDKLDECTTIYYSGYLCSNINWKSQISHIIKISQKLNKKVIVDFSNEASGFPCFEYLSTFLDIGNVYCYINTPIETTIFDILVDNGCNIIHKPFFLINTNDYIPEYTKIVPIKKFLYFVGKHRQERLYLLGLLSYYNLLDSGYVSYIQDGMIDAFKDYNINQLDTSTLPAEKISLTKSELKKITDDLILDSPSFDYKISHGKEYPGYYYKSVDFVIVVETDMRAIFITEKTTKCIQTDTKFILLSAKGQLEYTKNMSIEYLDKDISHLTDWCDVSYDEIEDTWQRVEKIIEIVRNSI